MKKLIEDLIFCNSTLTRALSGTRSTIPLIKRSQTYALDRPATGARASSLTFVVLS